MSFAFGIAQDAENQVGRRGKAMNTRSSVHAGPKRTVLGAITNQVNQVRVQPTRAAKPKVSLLYIFEIRRYFDPRYRQHFNFLSPLTNI